MTVRNNEKLQSSDPAFQRLAWLAHLGEMRPGIAFRLRMTADRSISFDFLGGRALADLGFSTTRPLPPADALFALIHPDDVAAVQRSLLAAFAARGTWECRFRFVHGKRILPVETCAAALPGDGDDRVWDGMFTEIPDARRQTAAAAEEAAQIDLANRTKHVFLANISHELRTPLNAIIGFSEMIMMRCQGDISGVYLGYAENIHKSGRHLLTLINDLIDLSREATMTGKALKPGDTVAWNSSQGEIHGTVEKKQTSDTAIKGHKVKASPDNPEYIVRSDKTGAIAAHKPEALHKTDK